MTSYTQSNFNYYKYDEKRYLNQFVSEMFDYTLKVLHNNCELNSLLPWQHTGFQTTSLLKAFLPTCTFGIPV